MRWLCPRFPSEGVGRRSLPIPLSAALRRLCRRRAAGKTSVEGQRPSLPPAEKESVAGQRPSLPPAERKTVEGQWFSTPPCGEEDRGRSAILHTSLRRKGQRFSPPAEKVTEEAYGPPHLSAERKTVEPESAPHLLRRKGQRSSPSAEKEAEEGQRPSLPPAEKEVEEGASGPPPFPIRRMVGATASVLWVPVVPDSPASWFPHLPIRSASGVPASRYTAGLTPSGKVPM